MLETSRNTLKARGPFGALASHVEDTSSTDGFTVRRSAPSDQGTVIQAKKGGFLREVVAADRALSVTITGQSSDFTVGFGIGKWLEHLGVAAIETLLLSDLFLVVDVADSAWNSRSRTSCRRRQEVRRLGPPLGGPCGPHRTQGIPPGELRRRPSRG